jgi:hypothetical protein
LTNTSVRSFKHNRISSPISTTIQKINTIFNKTKIKQKTV